MLGKIGLFAIVPVLALAACGSEGDSTFGDDGGSGGNGDGSTGTSSSGGGFSSGSNGGEGGASGGNGDGGACEGAVSRAEKLPVQMLILLDRSGSMGDHDDPAGDHANRLTRWVPVTTALAGFLADPVSTGINANLRYFPRMSNKATPVVDKNDVPANVATNCSKATYATPDVALTALPAPASFPFAANADMYGTPTYPALLAAVDEATALTTADPDAKVVVVLVTDGEPAGCPAAANNTIAKCAEAVSNKPFLTYAIGVGNITGLDSVAAAGGTNEAIEVPVDNAAASQAAFTAAIEDIRRKAVSCEVAIPPPPAGKTFDRDKVNVSVTSGATQTPLTYDPTCAGAGWRYDDANAPTQIVLCPATCEPLKTDPNVQVDVAFGCERRTGPN